MKRHLRLPFAVAFAAVLGTTLAACSGGGAPTAIEIDIDRIEIVQFCRFVVTDEQCSVGVAAFTAEDQRIANPVLRWSSTNSAVARIVSEDRSVALIEGVGPGTANIEVSNTTNTATARNEVRVARPSK